jgi:hypothetical protein
MEHPAGFEPATSRLTDEVTAIFTTDRGKRIGREQAMLLLPVRAELSYGISAGGTCTPRPPRKRGALTK